MARVEKINQALKEEISRILQREVKDPRLGFVTVTHVEVSRDLQHAKVYFSVLGDLKKIKEAQEGLNSARGFIRRLIGQNIQMRYTPEINFIFDKSIEYGVYIEKTIERIKDELKGRPQGDKEK